MINLPKIIELDEYLDLTEFKSISQEFKENLSDVEQWSNIGIFSPDEKLEEPEGAKTLSLRILKDISNITNWAAIDKRDLWKDGPVYQSTFPKIYQFVNNLPFKNVARVFLSYTKDKTEILPHAAFTPGIQEPWRQEFLWFSLLGDKKMWVSDWDSTLEYYNNGFVIKDKFPMEYSNGVSCWFNPIMLHGIKNGDDFSASLRIDGEFTEEFREKLFGDTKWKTTFNWVDERHLLPEDSRYLEHEK